jgi:hypothetical protein
MSGKSRALAVAAATAGVIGMWAPAASAFTGPSGNSSGDTGVVNVSHDQVPIQVCKNYVPINVIGIQVPLDQIAVALGLLSAGNTISGENAVCDQPTVQKDQNARSEKRHLYRGQDMSTGNYQSSRDGDMQWTPSLGHGHGSGSSSGDTGVVNLSHDQVPIQVCKNYVPINVIGIQVPLDQITGAVGIAAPTEAVNNSVCHQPTVQKDQNASAQNHHRG